MKIKGTKKVRQTARWLRSRWGQQVMIVAYHRIADMEHDPYGVGIRPSHFAEQMAVLRQEAHPISLTQLGQGLQTGKLPRRAVLVTFDDGYVDVLRQAQPLLMQYEIPATTFMVSDALGQVFWWDELARLILEMPVLPDHLSLNLDGRTLTWSLLDAHYVSLSKQAPSPRQHLLMMLYGELLNRPELRADTLAELRTWTAADAIARAAARDILTPVELTALAEGGLIEIGSHTRTHPLLATLSPAMQEAEIRQSKATLEEILGQPVTTFSYPHGSVTAVTQQLVQQSGYTLACASNNGLIGRSSNPYRLPRFWPRNWDGDTFTRWLRRWLND